MWGHTVDVLGNQTQCFALSRDGVAITYRDVIDLWQHDESFRSFFIALLAGTQLSAYRWETPPVTVATVSRPFEFVLLDSPGLERRPDIKPFAEHLRGAASNQQVVTFTNLGKDATLVVPCQVGPAEAYVHLATFVRHAPAAQVHEFWQAIGAAMAGRLSRSPLWLSTAGMGVPWLHARLDSRPKYYGFEPYRECK